MTKAQQRKLAAVLVAASEPLAMPDIPTPSADDLASDPEIGLRRRSEQWAQARAEITSRIDTALQPLGYQQRTEDSRHYYYVSPMDRITLDIKSHGAMLDDREIQLYTPTLRSRALDEARDSEHRAISRSLNRAFRG